MAEREITITIKGQNLTQDGFDEARRRLLDLDDSAKKPKPAVDALGTSWTKLTSSFLSASLIERGASALLSFGRHAIEVTGNLTDLSGKTGIGVESLQRLNYVTSQSGVGLEQIARGAVVLGRNLVEGKSSTVEAVKALGLNLDDLIQRGPDQAFLAIGQAIATVPNPMEQAALATALFGKAGADYLPAFTDDMADLARQAEESGAILDADLVAAGDAAGDALGRLSLVGQAVLGKVLIPLMPAIEAAADWLGTMLPAALDASRAGVDWLLRQGLQLQVWLFELAASVAQTVRDVPVLGRVFGQSAADVAELETQAQFARDALNSFDAQGMKPAAATIKATTPLVTGFGEAMAETGRKSRAAGTDVGVVWGELGNIVRFQIAGVINPDLVSFATTTDNATKAMDELTDAIYRTQDAAIAIGPPLENLATLPWVEFRESVAQTGTETEGWFSRIFGSAEGLGGSISSIFQDAFTGGGGALGAVQSFATQTLSNLLGMIPGIGQWAQMFAGPIIAMFTRLIGRADDFFRRLFGGPGQGELNDRNMVAEWEDQVIASSEAAQSETERWRAVVVAVTEAYLRNGRTAEEAAADVERLWASSREGGEETWRVVDEVNRKMMEAAAAASGAAGAAEDAFARTGESGRTSADDVEQAMAAALAATALAAESGSEEAKIAAAIAVQEAERIRAAFEKEMDLAADASADAMARIGDVINNLPDEVDFTIRGNYRAPDSDDRAGYRTGTYGRHGEYFRNFGSGTPTVLHGEEMVLPKRDLGQFLRDMVGAAPASPAQAVQAAAIYILNDFTGARQVTESEFGQIQQRLASGGLMVPARAVVAR